MTEYKEMTREELEPCAMLAADAFFDYEYFSNYIPNDKHRKHFLNTLLDLEFRLNMGKPGTVFFTARDNGSLAGCTQLCAPGFKRPSDPEYLMGGWMKVMFRGGIRRVNAWHKIEMLAAAPCHELPGKNWYLSLLAVARAEKGKGTGTRFLNECLIPYVKNAGGETFSLFTNSESNLAFYEKNGFTIFDEKQFEYEGKTTRSWSLVMDLRK